MTKENSITQKFLKLKSKLRNIFQDDSILLSAGEYPNDAYYRDKKNELKKIYRNKEARNIAIWGYAGAGKSSFIRHFERKTIHIPFCQFLKISLSPSIYGMEGYSKQTIEENLAKQINRQYQRNELFTAVDIFICIMSVLYFINEKWITTNLALSNEIYGSFGIIFFGVGSVSFLKLLVMFLNSVSLERVVAKLVKEDDNSCLELEFPLKSPEIKKTLVKKQWKIRSTVVFEDLELLESDVFISVVNDLLQLNTEINSEIQKRFIGKICRKPLRFIYVCRDGEIRKKMGDKQFQDRIFIRDHLSCNNLYLYIEECVNRQISKEQCFPMTENRNVKYDFDYFCTLAKLIGTEDLNYRKINQILKRYINLWNEFSRSGFGKSRIVKNDYTKLLGYAIYEEYYPEDAKQFKIENCLAIKDVSNEDLDFDNPKLFLFLTRECSEDYRVNYSCIKYLGINDQDINRWENELVSKYQAGEYETVLKLINILVCCNPEKADYVSYKKEIEEKIKNSVVND